MKTLTREEAATARSQGVRAVADRPRERRCSAEPSALSNARILTKARTELRDSAGDGGGFDFSGYASVVETGYEMFDFFGPYTEIVSATAFDKTLAQTDLDVPLVLGHDSMRRIARTTNGSLNLSVDEIGLLCEAPSLDPTDADVAYIAPKIRSGLIDEMSFRFSITAGQWSPDYTEYRIDGANIDRGDVSIVGYGANPATSVQLRSLVEGETAAAALSEMTPIQLRALETDLRAAMRGHGMQPALLLRELLRA